MGDYIHRNMGNQRGKMAYPYNYKVEYIATHHERAMIHVLGYPFFLYTYQIIDWLITTLLQRTYCRSNKKNDRGKKHSANGLLQCHFMLHMCR